MSWAVGLLAGFLSSAPVGPVNLAVIGNGLRRGFRSAFLTGLGAVVPDMLYLLLALLGLTQVESLSVGLPLKLLGAAVLLGVGVHDLRQALQGGRDPRPYEGGDEIVRGVVLCLSNPFVFLYWVGVLGFLRSRGWVSLEAFNGLCFVAGMACGALLWFLLLARFCAVIRRRARGGFLKAMSVGVSLALIGLAIYWSMDILISHRHRLG